MTTAEENNEFRPDWVSAPGDTIADILEEQNLSSVDFARRMGKTPEEVFELLNGRTMITIETARKLEVVLGSPATFWMVRESQYRDDVARLTNDEKGSAAAGWLSELPLNDMVRFGWLKVDPRSTNKVAECLKFFDVPDVEAWRDTYRGILETAVFRTSSLLDSKPGAVAAWLQQGEIQSALVDCERWDAKRFQDTLLRVRGLTRERDPSVFLPELIKSCADCGVAVAIVRAPSGCPASGATRFLSPSKALLLLSFRYLSDDHFWFTFFHEAGHLLLHGKKALFLEGSDMPSNKEEEEANAFAARILVPPQFQRELLSLPVNGRKVIRFARRVGVSPGIVVGQLQHLGRFTRRQLNNLKTRFAWGDK